MAECKLAKDLVTSKCEACRADAPVLENNEIQEVAKNQIEQQLISSGMQNVGKDVNKFVENYLKHNNGENYLKILNQSFFLISFESFY